MLLPGYASFYVYTLEISQLYLHCAFASKSGNHHDITLKEYFRE